MEKIDAELHRVFDICHGCRRCFNLCDSFPRLFDLVDESANGRTGYAHMAALTPRVRAALAADFAG